jgi:hypothetical protein
MKCYGCSEMCLEFIPESERKNNKYFYVKVRNPECRESEFFLSFEDKFGKRLKVGKEFIDACKNGSIFTK